jgi:inner membrane protein
MSFLDTGTHLVVGFGLAGLAQIDPVIASNQDAMIAVLIGTVVGSQIPDADGLLRLKSNASYIRNHRGFSHSLPAIVAWTILIVSAISIVFQDIPLWHVSLWTGIAVVFHVFSDLFNTYGTQALRPFSDKWISWNIIHIFDPFIFFSHVGALLIWSMRLAEPQLIFPILYIFIGWYYLWRILEHLLLKKNLKKQDPFYKQGDTYQLFTTFNINVWNVIKLNKNSNTYVLGELKIGKLKWTDEVKCEQHPAIEASKQHEDVKAMLYFTDFACASVKEHQWGYEVRWSDIRYRYRKQFPFVAVVLMNHDFEVLDSYTGWLSESKLEKKLRIDLY